MLEPSKPELRLNQCLSESVSVWASHLPVFFLTAFLLLLPSFILFPLVIVGTLTGLAMLSLDALEGNRVRIRAAFRPLRHPVRFVALSTGLCVGTVVWWAIVVLVGMATVPVDQLPEGASTLFQGIRDAIRGLVSDATTTPLPDFQPGPDNWGAVFPFVFLLLVILWEGVVLFLRSFYVPIIVSHLGISVVDAYVESRNTVIRHGYLRHAILLVAAGIILSLPIILIEDLAGQILASMLVLPIALGFGVSAYLQTIDTERRNAILREQQFVEMRDELQTAHDMQMDLLPEQPPELEGYELAGTSIPANNVGGDYFTYRWLDEEEGRLAFVIADVSGKAMHAAVTALRFSEMLRYECNGRTRPGPILDGLTRALDEQTDSATYVTCCIAVLDVETGSVEIANAGHCYPIIATPARELEVNGLPLGMPALIRPDTPYESTTFDLKPGDRLVFYSDGVVEAAGPDGEMYEEERLIRELDALLPSRTAEKAVERIRESVDAFTQGESRTDDLTIVVLDRAPEGSDSTA